MVAQVSHQVGVDHAFDDVPTVLVVFQPVVKPAREDRLQRQLRASLERREYDRAVAQRRSSSISTMTLLTTCLVDGTPS